MKAVFSYLIVLLSAFAYMILFDRNAGAIMTAFLVIVPLISVFLTVYSRKRVKLEIDAPSELLKKNSRFTVKVLASKDTFLPLPVISFELTATAHFRKPEYDMYRFSMSENREIALDIDLVPEVCGTAAVTVGKVRITDYLGIFKFKIRIPDITEEVCIMPEVYELNDYSDILRSISDTLPDNDDERETSVVFGKTTLPGYSYRSYVPGDSLKKINWKLSSKKNELFVRTDEAAGMTMPNIILDITSSESDRNRRSGIFRTEQITEGALSLLDMCVKNGIECNFVYPRSGVMVTESASSPSDVERISSEMIRNLTEPAAVSLQSDPDSKSTDVSIIFVSGIYSELENEAAVSVQNGNNVKLVIPEEQAKNSSTDLSDVWMLTENHTLTRCV